VDPAAVANTSPAVKLAVLQSRPPSSRKASRLRGHGHIAQSKDRLVTQGVWKCTAGKFRWDYTGNEIVMVLEGKRLGRPRAESR